MTRNGISESLPHSECPNHAVPTGSLPSSPPDVPQPRSKLWCLGCSPCSPGSPSTRSKTTSSPTCWADSVVDPSRSHKVRGRCPRSAWPAAPPSSSPVRRDLHNPAVPLSLQSLRPLQAWHLLSWPTFLPSTASTPPSSPSSPTSSWGVYTRWCQVSPLPSQPARWPGLRGQVAGPGGFCFPSAFP